MNGVGAEIEWRRISNQLSTLPRQEIAELKDCNNEFTSSIAPFRQQYSRAYDSLYSTVHNRRKYYRAVPCNLDVGAVRQNACIIGKLLVLPALHETDESGLSESTTELHMGRLAFGYEFWPCTGIEKVMGQHGTFPVLRCQYAIRHINMSRRPFQLTIS